MLALFYETRWGRSAVHCQAENDARRFAGLARCYEAEMHKLKARLEALNHTGAANAPTFEPVRPLPALQLA